MPGPWEQRRTEWIGYLTAFAWPEPRTQGMEAWTRRSRTPEGCSKRTQSGHGDMARPKRLGKAEAPKVQGLPWKDTTAKLRQAIIT